MRDRHVLVTAVSGAVLILMGVLILSGELRQLNSDAQKLLSNLGLDFLYNI
jgi:cytochrome c-type biogenesis protein